MSDDRDRRMSDDKETKQLLAFIERTAKEVEAWPAWMKGKADPERRQPPPQEVRMTKKK
jgi:hypothetical protein